MSTIGLFSVILFTFAAVAKVWTIDPLFREELKDTNPIPRYSSLREPSLWDYRSPSTYCDIQSNRNLAHACSGNSCPGVSRPEQHSYGQKQNTTNTTAIITTAPPTLSTGDTPCGRKFAGAREIANIVLRLITGAAVLYGFLTVIPMLSVFLAYKLSIWSVRYLS